jgi:hypothetical protein
MKNEVIEKIASLITAAFGLVAALAWNDAIKLAFDKMFEKGEGLTAMLSYAVIVTIIAVIVTIWLGRLSEKEKK